MDGGHAGPDPPIDPRFLQQGIAPTVVAAAAMHGMMAVVDWPADLLEELSLNLRPRRSFSKGLAPGQSNSSFRKET